MIVAQGVRDAVRMLLFRQLMITTMMYIMVSVKDIRELISQSHLTLKKVLIMAIYNRLDNILGLRQSSGYHEKRTSEGKLEFRIWGLSVNIKNAPFAAGDQSLARFQADSTIMLEVPDPGENYCRLCKSK